MIPYSFKIPFYVSKPNLFLIHKAEIINLKHTLDCIICILPLHVQSKMF